MPRTPPSVGAVARRRRAEKARPGGHAGLRFVALALAALLLAAPSASALSPSVRSVGELFVDAQGRASGENLATRIGEADGLIEGFSSSALGTEVFSKIRIDGFAASEKIAGAGTSGLTLRGTNAVVGIHDNLHSVLSIAATKPTTVTYTLGPDVVAQKLGAGVVSLSHVDGRALGTLLAHGAEGEKPRGEVFDVKRGEVVARAQSRSEILYLAKPASTKSPEQQDALVAAAAQGALASLFVTEFTGSVVRTSQVDFGASPVARTTSSAAGGVSSSVRSTAAAVLAYDLAYETLPARSAGDVALFIDGEQVAQATSAKDVLAAARGQVAVYHAYVESGRTQVLASIPSGEHRVSVSASASASTESQARAEQDGEDDARVYGSFEYHTNGKLTGDFVTSVVPDGRATLLGFTSLASSTELFERVELDGGAEASFHAAAIDEMRLETVKADLRVLDDVHATLMIVARAPSEAVFSLASGVRASSGGDGILLLDGPRGPAGALVLLGDGTLALDAAGDAHARLAAGSRLVYRGVADEHASERALLTALAAGRVGAQLLAGSQDGAPATRATTYADDVTASVRAGGRGMLLVNYLADSDDAPRAFVLDARGASLAAKSASDIRVTIDGVDAAPAATPEDVLDAAGVPRYHAMTSVDGALRVIVHTASATGGAVVVAISSGVENAARAQARTDAFGAFRVYHDGSAVGNFVTLKADQAAGAVSGFTMLSTGRPVFASLAAGHSPYVVTSGDGTSVLRLENRESRAEFSDTTSGFAKFIALQDTDAAIRLAAGLSAQTRGPGVVQLLDERGEQVGSLILIGAGSVEARAEDEVRARLSTGSQLLFRAHAGIESELSAAQRTMIDQAIAAGHVAAQVIVQSQAELSAEGAALERTARAEGEGMALAAREAFGDITSSVTASYGLVNVVTSATREKVELTVASSLHAGKTIIVSLDPETIPGMATGDAVIRFDGHLVTQAASYADILDPLDDGDAAEYFVLAGEAGTQVLVSIPHFSVHTVTLEQRSDKADSIYMYATLFLGLLVVVESALLARGRVKQNSLSSNDRRP